MIIRNRYVLAALVLPLLVLLFLAACSSSLIKPVATSPARAAVLGAAGAQVGAPYRYDGADRKGFDASGLVFFSYAEAGFAIPRDAQGQLRAATAIPFYDVKPADLLFYGLNPAQSGSDDGLHVGLYVGNGQMLHAPLNRDEVVLETADNPYWLQRFINAGKILP